MNTSIFKGIFHLATFDYQRVSCQTPSSSVAQTQCLVQIGSILLGGPQMEDNNHWCSILVVQSIEIIISIG